MPLDDLSLDLTPPGAPPRPPEPSPPPAPTLEVMTRALRLPTASRRQARSIVRMQLDRLSPLPVADTVFDLVLLREEGAEALWGLGLARKSALAAPAFGATALVPVAKSIEGAEVVFRFRNPGAVDDREARWLKHAPAAAAVAMGLAALALAGNLRADQWRTLRLPEIAQDARASNRLARDARDQRAARADWAGIERVDASTRLLCVLARVRSAAPSGVAITGLSADARGVRLALPAGADPTALIKAGGMAPPAPPSQAGVNVAFSEGVCR